MIIVIVVLRVLFVLGIVGWLTVGTGNADLSTVPKATDITLVAAAAAVAVRLTTVRAAR